MILAALMIFHHATKLSKERKRIMIKSHRTILFFLILLIVFCANSSFGQEAFPAADLKFQKIFGYRLKDKNLYCLLGNGFFRTTSSNEEKSFIKKWIQEHPKAQAIPVAVTAEASTVEPLVYIWLVDGSENLNLLLVRKGIFPGSVMMDAVQFDEISKKSQEKAQKEEDDEDADESSSNAPEAKENPSRRLISDDRYNAFLKELDKEEAVAKNEKSGIWSDKFKHLQEE
jgi:hypothetical protein